MMEAGQKYAWNRSCHRILSFHRAFLSVERNLLSWEDKVTFCFGLREEEYRKGICGLVAEGNRRRSWELCVKSRGRGR